MNREQLMYENERLRQELASRDRDMAKLRERLQKLESKDRIKPLESFWFTGKYTLEELRYCSENDECIGCPLLGDCPRWNDRDAGYSIYPEEVPYSELVLHAKEG